MNDELQQRLRRHDPAADAPIHPVDGPRAAALMEQIMNTPMHSASPDASVPRRPAPSRKAWWGFGVAAVALVAAGATAVIVNDSGSDSDTKSVTQATFDLPAASGGPATSMCIRVDAYQPTAGQPAFEGTVLSVGGGTVTLQVSKWYSGGDADQVVLNAADTSVPDPVLEGGVAFTVGGKFLVMALDGQVVGCGVSGEVSPELTALYQQWFPA